MKISKQIGRVLAAAVILGASASALADVDQNNPYALTAQINTQAEFLVWQQTVVVGMAGILSSVDLWTTEKPGTFELFINRGTGWQTDANDYSTIVSPGSDSFITVNVSSAALNFAVGDSFVIGIKGMGPTNDCCGLGATTGDSYTPGALYLNGSTLAADTDLAFRTNVNAVPEPETYAMLLAGLGLMGYLRRRQQRG